MFLICMVFYILIKQLMNDFHIKHLTPKSAQTLLEIHSNLLDIQTSEMLLKLVHFEIKMDWQSTSVVVKPTTDQEYKQLRDNDSKINSAIENTNNISSNKMQAISSRATKNKVLYFSILNTIILLFLQG